ncbi:sensor histidine kinase [Sporomusa malonica]|uniref:Histidine kinase-, DNA gyrase B-, and HSP90-like ATPase n=1 Tax=Sporomusa malonica TaxID=112901 RepID=A0A1W2B9T0_9FIRM|nr:sensor histidine kinase [Sporomusa malonica]SMC69773.1 Histidine kinase-, DNA gyrase B-, and HSP90-like ATPase [Sporomusa malonica]
MSFYLQRPEWQLSAAQEQEYRANCWRRDSYAGAISIFIIVGLLFSTFWGDILIVKYYDLGISAASIYTVFLLIGLRAFVTLFTLALGIWLYKHRHRPRYETYDVFLFVWMLLLVPMMLLSETTRPTTYYTGSIFHLGLVIMMYIVLPQQNLYFRTLPPLLFTTGFIYIYSSMKQPPAYFGFASIYAVFIMANLVGFVVSYMTFTMERQRFALDREKDRLVSLLAQGKEELEQKNRELMREKELVASYEADLRKQEVQREKMRTLQAQIKPHFLYNTLSTIAYYCRKQPEQAYSLIGDLSVYLQGAFKLHTEQINLENELQLVRAYLSIESARMEERLKTEFEVEGDFTACRLPPFTLQPLAENAVRHGLAPVVTGGTLKIVAKEEADCYLFEVIDNGTGITEEKQADLLAPHKRDNDSGIGLANVHERLMGLYGSGLRIHSQVGSGTSISFCILKRTKGN